MMNDRKKYESDSDGLLDDSKCIRSDLVKEWHPTKNGDLLPSDVTRGSNKKVWWMCDKGHEWQATINNRSKNNNCPYCGKRKLLRGYNDLATINPTLAKEWNYAKNGDLKPTDVFPNSNKKAWWICDKGHEWQARIHSRSRGTKCPICTRFNQHIVKGYNDLSTINPSLAKEWHLTKNGDLKPNDISLYSNQKVWWQCNKGHEWQAVVNNRNKGNGCPYCSGRNKLNNNIKI